MITGVRNRTSSEANNAFGQTTDDTSRQLVGSGDPHRLVHCDVLRGASDRQPDSGNVRCRMLKLHRPDITFW